MDSTAALGFSVAIAIGHRRRDHTAGPPFQFLGAVTDRCGVACGGAVAAAVLPWRPYRRIPGEITFPPFLRTAPFGWRNT